MRRLTLPVAGLPGLDALLNGDLWERWQQAGKVFAVRDLRRSVRYLRLKSGTSCRLAIFRDQGIAQGSDPPAAFLVYAFPDPARAWEFFDKVTSGKIWGKPQAYEAFIDHDSAIVGVPFPSDREVPGLRHVYRHHRLKNIVVPLLTEFDAPGWRVVKRKTSLHLLSYKIGRRAVFAYKLYAEQEHTAEQREITLHLKVESDVGFSVERLQALRDLAGDHAHSGVRLPEMVGWDSTQRLTVRRWYLGSVLSSRLMDPLSFDAAALALAQLHRHPFRAAALAATDAEPRVRDEIEHLTMLLPTDERRLRNIGERIAQALAPLQHGDQTLLHGDFHPGQVVLQNGDAVLIDLDRCRYGAPELDLGSFLAHALEFGAGEELRQRFVDTYRSANQQLDPQSLRAAYALGLLRRCARPFRDLVADWPLLITRRIDRLESLLDGGPL